MTRSLKAVPFGIDAAKKALIAKKLTQEIFAEELHIAKSTISNFFTGRPVERIKFVEICEKLELDWEKVSGQKTVASTEESDGNSLDIDQLVQLVRRRCKEDVMTRHNKMKVLDMERAMDLNKIYTDVNILEKQPRKQRLEIEELLSKGKLEEFERWGLGNVQQKRVEGIEAVRKHDKLMILGKPGAGKTTFLKYLATSCINSNFLSDRVPVFVMLKHFSDSEVSLNLLGFILQQFAAYGIDENIRVKRRVLDTVLKPNAKAIETLLLQGRMLVLLDGLDEVSGKHGKTILREIEKFTENYPRNQIVLTCRIAAKEYTFDQFTEVEIADFDEQQIATFAKNWFFEKDVKAEDFLTELKKINRVEELATSPLLLTLLCLTFEESGSFPNNRSELYKEGLDALLAKWDAKRGIRRDSVYNSLSVKKKQDMLSQIALTTFEKRDYLIKQNHLESYICDYIRNAANAKTDDEGLHFDSEVVLKEIEAQHGLFVERAKGIYSFSHLTFHEYFAARQILSPINPKKLYTSLQKLIRNITDRRWHEVFLLSVGMASEADYLLLFMKNKIDKMWADEDKLQLFFQWIDQKSKEEEGTIKEKAFGLSKASYKPYTLREYYFTRTLDRSLKIDINSDLVEKLDLAYDRDRKLALTLEYERDLARDHTIMCADELTHFNDLAFRLERSYKEKCDQNPGHAASLGREIGNANGNAKAHGIKFINAVDNVLLIAFTIANRIGDDRLYNRLSHIKQAWLPDPDKNWNQFKIYWEGSGKEWIKIFLNALYENRRIEHGWQFEKEQKEKLWKYYEANMLLLKCLNSGCHVTSETRQKIEDELLLPIASLPNPTN
ncbi:Histidine kinase [Tumidithrix helvetica PCC 7403]|uniref:NACHT domain-containing protein n=1 Tax=Tumidithrix helvetica TaxID=3457545 RepID=UPI003CBA3671